MIIMKSQTTLKKKVGTLASTLRLHSFIYLWFYAHSNAKRGRGKCEKATPQTTNKTRTGMNEKVNAKVCTVREREKEIHNWHHHRHRMQYHFHVISLYFIHLAFGGRQWLVLGWAIKEIKLLKLKYIFFCGLLWLLCCWCFADVSIRTWAWKYEWGDLRTKWDLIGWELWESALKRFEDDEKEFRGKLSADCRGFCRNSRENLCFMKVFWERPDRRHFKRMYLRRGS